MQANLSVKVPTLVVHQLDQERIAVRFQQIGTRQRFNMILHYFRFAFPLAICEELEQQAWWVIAATQREELEKFCRTNGLQLIEP